MNNAELWLNRILPEIKSWLEAYAWHKIVSSNGGYLLQTFKKGKPFSLRTGFRTWNLTVLKGEIVFVGYTEKETVAKTVAKTEKGVLTKILI